MKKLLAIIVVLILLLLLVCSRASSVGPFGAGYFDAAATVEPLQDALAAAASAARLGNPSSSYATAASAELSRCKQYVCSYARAPGYAAVFNSSASEGNSFILRSVADMWNIPHIIMSSIEHKSLLECARQLESAGRATFTYVYPNINGIVDPVLVAEAIRPDTRLICIMDTNNETGARMDVREIGAVARRAGVLYHVDAVQSFARHRPDVAMCGVDCMVASGHKFGAMPGTGVMLLSPQATSLLRGRGQICGSQNDGIRGGTENVPGAVSFATALRTTTRNRASKNIHLLDEKNRLISELTKKYTLLDYASMAGMPETYTPPQDRTEFGIVLLGNRANTSEHILLLSIVRLGTYDLTDRFCNIKLKEQLEKRGYSISIGSACNTRSSDPSHVLLSMRAPFVVRSGVVRISIPDGANTSNLSRALIECIQLQSGRN